MVLFLSHLAMVLLGAVLTLIVIFRKRNGTLHINIVNPNKDVYSFEFLTPLNDLWKSKILVFTVKVDDDTVSQ